jgi:hypothetical protein
MSDSQKGASSSVSCYDSFLTLVIANERLPLDELLLAAARTDNEDLLEEVFDDPDAKFDINFRDGCVHIQGKLLT